jgi:secreted PhoX family phosphatase
MPFSDAANQTIRMLKPLGTNWVVSTLAGQVGNPGSADGTNSSAQFNSPNGIAVDTSGNLYIADADNEAIRKVMHVGTNWVVSTIGGRPGFIGAADGTGSAARFNTPFGVAVDTLGNIYVADSDNDTIRKGVLTSSLLGPALRTPDLTAGQFRFLITGQPELQINIETSADLSNWQFAGSYVLSAGTNYFINPGLSAKQFYRGYVP